MQSISRISMLLIVFTLLNAQTDTIKIDSGLMIGVLGDDSTVKVFKGIPYAEPPIGNLRWKPPQPVSHWNGVYSANSFGPICLQVLPREGSFYEEEFYGKEEPQSEDCLYLNVWTPDTNPDELKPVMMWIHGGGFSHGSGSMPVFNGESFAKNGVVLVTINYRLGIFGLFAHPDLTKESEHSSSGNYGLLDQIAALKWIKKNIRSFGGDPENVTVFGQSSGAGNINKLMASPLAENLIHKAILQSGSAYTFGRTQRLHDAEKYGEEIVNELNMNSMAELRKLPAAELLDKTGKYNFKPNIDGWFLHDYVYSIFEEGNQLKIPLIIGSNEDEGSTLFGPQLNSDIFMSIIERSYGNDAERFLQLYPHETDKQARSSFNKGWRDEMAWGAHRLAAVHSEVVNRDVFVYYFNRVPPGRNSERYGAFHSAEIAYVFNNLYTINRPWKEEDKKLADRIISYWVNFAEEGNPNNGEFPLWKNYDPEKRNVQQLGESISSKRVLEEDIIEFYNMIFERKNE